MSNSLKDQLLGLGFKSAPKPELKQKPKPEQAKPGHKPGVKRHRKPAVTAPAMAESQHEIDLSKAFALRKQQETRERERGEREKLVAALHKKQAKESVGKLLDGQILNASDADIARHFSYGGKIKRLYVDSAQLAALNAGKLGIVQFDGRYCLVSKDVTLAVRALLPSLVALYCDGNEESLPEGYDDPRFQVPDDLIW